MLARHSYVHDEIVWGKRFAPAFFADEKGDLVVELRKVGELALARPREKLPGTRFGPVSDTPHIVPLRASTPVCLELRAIATIAAWRRTKPDTSRGPVIR